MLNTDCCQSCEKNRVKEIDILGKTLKVKNYICSSDGINYKEKPEHVKLQLFVNMLSFCPAACRFCVAGDTAKDKRIDIDKFARTMKLLKQEDRVRGVKITGGEPFYDIGLLNETVSVLYETFGYDMEVAVSTNGIGLEDLHKIKDLEHIEAIHISRHHYDDGINKDIFGSKKFWFEQGSKMESKGAGIPDSACLRKIIESVPFKDIFVFNCMLLKDYINTPGEAHKFMDYAIELGVPKVGFVTCSPVNGYAAEQSIPYESVIKEDDPALLFTRGFFDHEYCHCSDGVYVAEDGRIVQFYGRSTKMEKYSYCRGLVYDVDNHLKDGFGGDIVY